MARVKLGHRPAVAPGHVPQGGVELIQKADFRQLTGRSPRLVAGIPPGAAGAASEGELGRNPVRNAPAPMTAPALNLNRVRSAWSSNLHAFLWESSRF